MRKQIIMAIACLTLATVVRLYANDADDLQSGLRATAVIDNVEEGMAQMILLIENRATIPIEFISDDFTSERAGGSIAFREDGYAMIFPRQEPSGKDAKDSDRTLQPGEIWGRRLSIRMPGTIQAEELNDHPKDVRGVVSFRARVRHAGKAEWSWVYIAGRVRTSDPEARLLSETIIYHIKEMVDRLKREIEEEKRQNDGIRDEIQR